jgi:hypothetical protein
MFGVWLLWCVYFASLLLCFYTPLPLYCYSASILFPCLYTATLPLYCSPASILLLCLYTQLTPTGLRAHHRRLPLRPPIRHQIRQRRRPHRANHRTARPIPQIALPLRKMEPRDLQPQRRAAQHPPAASLGSPGRPTGEIPLRRPRSAACCGFLDPDAGTRPGEEG